MLPQPAAGRDHQEIRERVGRELDGQLDLLSLDHRPAVRIDARTRQRS
ncbi:hypothetical protein [Solihabitans fulvus]|nr:hypothetical protein [Solihabitans fulvus]